jgi:hypothetical protein
MSFAVVFCSVHIYMVFSTVSLLLGRVPGDKRMYLINRTTRITDQALNMCSLISIERKLYVPLGQSEQKLAWGRK